MALCPGASQLTSIPSELHFFFHCLFSLLLSRPRESFTYCLWFLAILSKDSVYPVWVKFSHKQFDETDSNFAAWLKDILATTYVKIVQKDYHFWNLPYLSSLVSNTDSTQHYLNTASVGYKQSAGNNQRTLITMLGFGDHISSPKN